VAAKPAALPVKNQFLFGEETGTSGGQSSNPAAPINASAPFTIMDENAVAAKPAALPVKNQFLFGEETGTSGGESSNPCEEAAEEHSVENEPEQQPSAEDEVEEEQSGENEVLLVDPFAVEERAWLKDEINKPLEEDTDITIGADVKIRGIKDGSEILVCGQNFGVTEELGRGASGVVYSVSMLDATTFNDEYECALKVQKDSCAYEYYIARVIQERVGKNLRRLFVKAKGAVIGENGSLLLTERGEAETLQDVINANLKAGTSMDEHLVAFYTIELLRMCEAMQQCGIIHADLKPDNLILRNDKTSKATGWVCDDALHPQGLQLIDFQRAIDTTLYPPGTLFEGNCHAKNFQCIEMITDREWTYQLDIFGVCGVIHCLLHNEYMDVECVEGRWKPTRPFKRYWQKDLWTMLFDTLLNIPDCSSQPPLSAIRGAVEAYLFENQERRQMLQRALHKQTMMLFEQ